MIKIEEVFTESHMIEQFNIATRGKKTHTNVIKFTKESLYNLSKLRESILNNTYIPSKDYTFTIYEPKMRVVRANTFIDKIVQGLLVRYVLTPIIEPTLIYDNYASRINKGTGQAIDRLKEFLRSAYINYSNDSSNIYILQCDIKKYFDNISLDKVYEMINKLNIDIKLKRLLYMEIRPAHENNKGLCLGHELSQWIAIWYINELDHYIKETLHIKYYGRYMDDFYLIHNDITYLKYCRDMIANILNNYDLFLNYNKTKIIQMPRNVKFLGFNFVISNSGKVSMLLDKSSIKRVKKRINKLYKLIIDNKIQNQYQFILECIESLQSWKSHAAQATNINIIYYIDLYFYNNFYDYMISNNINYIDFCYVNGDYKYTYNLYNKLIKHSRNQKDLIWTNYVYSHPPMSIKEAFNLRKMIK